MKRRATFKQTKDSTRINTILRLFARYYANASIQLVYTTVWELVVAVILSAQCTDRQVNEVTAVLFKKYKTLEDYADSDLAQLENDVRSVGLFESKAKNIKAAAKRVLEKYNGEVPRRMKEILTLPGVARKTANVVLGNAYQVFDGIAVDTHVARISQRLRLVRVRSISGRDASYVKGSPILDYYKQVSAEKIERQLMKIIPQPMWFRYTYYVIEHGRSVCRAIKPKCGECFLRHLCPVVRVT